MKKLTHEDIVEAAKLSLKDYSNKLDYLPIGQIRLTPFNPPDRTKDDPKYRALRKSIEDHGQIDPIDIVSTPDRYVFYIADGNRRYIILSDLNANKVYCRIWKGGADWEKVVWMLYQLNSSKKQLTNKQAFQAHVLGCPPMTKGIAHGYKLYIKIWGSKQSFMPFFNKHPEGAHLEVLETAKSVFRRCWVDVPKGGIDYYRTLKMIIEWMVTYKLQSDTNAYLRKKYDLRRLRKSIEEDRNFIPGFEPHIEYKDGNPINLDDIRASKATESK